MIDFGGRVAVVTGAGRASVGGTRWSWTGAARGGPSRK